MRSHDRPLEDGEAVACHVGDLREGLIVSCGGEQALLSYNGVKAGKGCGRYTLLRYDTSTEEEVCCAYCGLVLVYRPWCEW